MALKPRPLSPHLQIYKPLFTMMMSIFHRITGVALYGVVVLLVVALLALSSSKAIYQTIAGFQASKIGLLLMICATWALFHHMLGGLRHFLWDTGRGFGEHEREFLAKATLVGSLILTALLWGFIFFMKG